MSSAPETRVEKTLNALAEALYRYPRLFSYPQVVLFFVCIFYTVHGLELDFSRDNLVGPNKKYHQIYLKFKQEFPTQDDLVVIVESGDMEKNRQFVERLGARLEVETNLFTDVFYKGDLKMMGNKALLFVPEKDLADLKKTLKDFRPFIQDFTKANSLTSLFSMINRQFLNAKPEQSAETDSMIGALPALDRILSQARDALDRSGMPVSPGINALFGAGQEAESQMYITFAKGRMYLVTARAAKSDLNGDAVARMRELMMVVQREVPGVNVGITGEPVLEFDEMQQSQLDSTVASVVSLVLCALIFIYSYRELGRPLKATLCLIVGLAYTMGYTTLVVGHLNLLTITFVPILIGLAIDFGVHLVTRYEEEQRRGRNEMESLRKAIVFTGQGIFTGCFTTAGAFLAMGITNFKGIQEMGIICGGGMLICLVPMMTLLPVLILKGRREVVKPENEAMTDRRAQIERIWLDRPFWVIGITVGLCAFSYYEYRKVTFDYNLLHMQSAGLPAVKFENKLIKGASKSVLFGAVVATNLTEAIALEAKLTNLTSVSSIESMGHYLTEDQSKKLKIIGEIKSEVAPIEFAIPDTNQINVFEFSRTLWSLSDYMGMAMKMIGTNEPALVKQFVAIRETIQELRKAMLKDPEASGKKLAAYQVAFFRDIRDTFIALKNQDDRARLRVEDLPPALRNRFIGITGKVLIQVYPKDDVWERDKQELFVQQLRSVVPDVTGTPVQLYEYTTLLKNSYEEAARYSLVAIVFLVFVHFRSITCVVLALFPVGIGWLWMVGMMGFKELQFNPANIMTLPLMIGIGVTNGIHILNRFAEENNPSILARSTGKAVLVSGLTTVVGFGSLLIAKHQGISSLGFVMSIGVAACMIAGLTFLPAVLTLMYKRGWRIKK